MNPRTNPGPRREPTRRALLIGISEYAPRSRIYGLPGADLNPALLEPELRRRGFTCVELLNAAATRAAIQGAIASLLSDAEPGDVRLLAYSGHGESMAGPDSSEPDGADEFIYPYDAGFLLPIRDDELASWLNQARPGVAIYCLFDACHSGTMPDGFLPSLRLWWWRARRFFRRVQFLFRRRDLGGRFMVFSACGDDEQADYSQMDRGRFTDALVNALRSDGVACNGALGLRIAQSFAARCSRDQHPQFRGPPEALRAGIFEPY